MERKTALKGSIPQRQPKPVATDEAEIDRIEGENALRVFDTITNIVSEALQAGSQFRLRPAFLSLVNGIATEGVEPFPGEFRFGDVEITNSPHEPPPHRDVVRFVDEMCEYVNTHWDSTPIHLAAYLLWRINWIHPFFNGNGRTARAISYMVLCIRLGCLLPGTTTIPEQIAEDKDPYYSGLVVADEYFNQGRIDVSALEGLLSKLLAVQLLDTYWAAGGTLPDVSTEPKG